MPHNPSYSGVSNHQTLANSAMAVSTRMIHGKYSSMFSKVVMGLSPNKAKEDASGDVEDQDH
jgi:hypothetical protein